MSLYNDLMRNHLNRDSTNDELQGVQDRTASAVSDLMMGVSAIGSLMFWASDSDDYAEGTAKADMYRLGAMLGTIGEVVRALSEIEANATYLRLIRVNEQKARADK